VGDPVPTPSQPPHRGLDPSPPIPFNRDNRPGASRRAADLYHEPQRSPGNRHARRPSQRHRNDHAHRHRDALQQIQAGLVAAVITGLNLTLIVLTVID